MKKLVALWTNWKLRKILQQFKYKDFIYVEKNKSFYHADKVLYVVEKIVWKNWFVPVMLCVKLPNCPAELFFDLKDILKYTIISAKPKFKHKDLITIDNEKFTVELIHPHIDSSFFVSSQCLTFKYMCVSVLDENRMINALECDLSEMINSSKMWNDLNRL